jgi:hypothetical protein
MVVSEDDANDKKGESDDSDEEEFFKVRGEGEEKHSSRSGSRNAHVVSLLGEEDLSRMLLQGDGSSTFDVSLCLARGG